MHVCLCLFVATCARECVCKDLRFHENTRRITFGLLQEDKALVLLLINTSLAKVTDWETRAAGVCVCVHVHDCVCMFFSYCCVHWDNFN